MAGGDRGTIGELLVAMLDEQLLESRSSGVLASDVLRCFGVWVVHRAPVSFQVAWPYGERVLDIVALRCACAVVACMHRVRRSAATNDRPSYHLRYYCAQTASVCSFSARFQLVDPILCLLVMYIPFHCESV